MEDKELEEKKDDLKEEEANTKAAHVAGKAAATYFGGPAGNAIYNAADKLGIAKPIEKLAGKTIKYTPGLNYASKKLNESGALDAADKGIDLAGGQVGNAASNTATNATNSLAKEGLAKDNLVKEGLESSNKTQVCANYSNNSTTMSNSSRSSSTSSTTEKENKVPKWLLIGLGIVTLFPFIMVLFLIFIVIIGFLAPGLGVINFFLGIFDFFNNDKVLKRAENSYYQHLEKAQQTAFQKYNVCIDVNLIHATLTVDKLGDKSLEEGEELCEDLESCNDSSQDVLTVSDYRKMEKNIDILANMQIKRKKYTMNKCHTSSDGDRCSEGKMGASEELVNEENLSCADIDFLNLIDLTWNGIKFKDSSNLKLVSRNDKEDNLFTFFTKKANKEKNYEYYLYTPAATYIQNGNGTETRKCEESVPIDIYDFAELSIGSWNEMESGVYFYNILESFVEDYYSDYLNKGSDYAEEGSERYNQAYELIDRIYSYYTLLGPNQNCKVSEEYICRDDEGASYYGGDNSLSRNEFIDRIAPIAISEMERTGVFASITIAQAILESANGASTLSTKYANYYGMTAGNCAPSAKPDTYTGTVLSPGKGGNTCSGNVFWDGTIVAMCNSRGEDCQWYRVYDSFENSTKDHSNLLTNSRYQLQNYSSLEEQLQSIIDGGYATASNYKKVILNLIDNHNLTQYDIGGFDGTIDPITEPQYTDMICNELGISNGDWANWKQYDSRWSGVRLGPSTVGAIGCAMTSVAIQIARSGTPTTLGENFNPGTFAQALTQVGGFDAKGNIYWATVSRIAPGFNFVGRCSTRSIAEVSSLVNQGYYVILNVKYGRHWIAVDRVEGNRIYMFDPGSRGTEVGQTYGLDSIRGCVYYRKG